MYWFDFVAHILCSNLSTSPIQSVQWAAAWEKEAWAVEWVEAWEAEWAVGVKWEAAAWEAAWAAQVKALAAWEVEWVAEWAVQVKALVAWEVAWEEE